MGGAKREKRNSGGAKASWGPAPTVAEHTLLGTRGEGADMGGFGSRGMRKSSLVAPVFSEKLELKSPTVSY